MKDLRWLGHSGFIIFGEKKIYIDPYQLEQGVLPKADIILITHSHEDHFSLKDIEDIAGNNTVIVGPKEIEGKTRKLTIKKFELMVPEKEIKIKGVTLIGVAAYNNRKQSHKKEEEWLGYIVEVNDKRYYFAGDTDRIPEMKGLKHIDVACVPISGVFTMDYKEAAAAIVQDIKPRAAVPMHFGSVVGSKLDAEKFVKIVNQLGIEARILEKK